MQLMVAMLVHFHSHLDVKPVDQQKQSDQLLNGRQ